MFKPCTLTLTLLLTMVSAFATAPAQEKQETKKETRPIDMLAWLNGGVWIADTSALGQGMKQIETRYNWSDNGAFLRFNTHFVMDKGTLKNYDGQFFWDRELNALEVWYMDASNNITKGPVKIDGNTMQIDFRAHDFEDKMANLRVTVLRRTSVHYTWQLQEQTDSGWKQLMQLEYMRNAAN